MGQNPYNIYGDTDNAFITPTNIDLTITKFNYNIENIAKDILSVYN